MEKLDDATFKQELVDLIPHLRAFARNLSGNPSAADDLAQDAMLKAWNARESYQPGTNMKAWTFTILRNVFYSEKRRSWRSQPLDPELAESTLIANDDPAGSMELLALRNAMNKLPDDQREAIVLIGAGGMSYEEAAEICGVAIGTIKSRVNRARSALAVILESNSAGFNSDTSIKAEDAFNDIMAQAEKLSNG